MKIFILLLILIINNSFSQNNSLIFFPPGINFKPLLANSRDAKIGLIFIPQNNNMKIDIGNNIDLLSLWLSESERITTGVEFLAYALSRSYQGKRLQIDAVDGFFGGNISYSKQFNENSVAGRFSIIHNCAHLVDGHWDRNNNKWIDDYEPVPYARDFTELITAYNYKSGFIQARAYTGFEYAFLVRPSDIKKLSFNGGFEVVFPELLKSFLGNDKLFFFAHHFSLSGTESYQGNNNSMLGIKLGKWNEKGVLLFINYYEGYDIFHSYYKRHIERFGMGVSVEFL